MRFKQPFHSVSSSSHFSPFLFLIPFTEAARRLPSGRQGKVTSLIGSSLGHSKFCFTSGFYFKIHRDVLLQLRNLTFCRNYELFQKNWTEEFREMKNCLLEFETYQQMRDVSTETKKIKKIVRMLSMYRNISLSE